jgi:Flp pilus assembly protein TadG
MKTIWASFLKRLFGEEQGQSALLLALSIPVIMGMGGLTVDVAHGYLVRTELQTAANASALAAVDGLYAGGSTSSSPSDTVKKLAEKYDASPAANNPDTGTNGYNYDPSMGSVVTTPATPCLGSLLVGTTCDASNWNYRANAVRVTESVSMPTYFMRILKIPSLTISATATALPRGKTTPYNIAIILDGTPSMAGSDPNCANKSEEQCALSAVEGMLSGIYPCINVPSCTASSSTNVAAVRVSIFTFPNVSTAQLPYEVNCSGTPTFMPYTLPKVPPAGSTAGYRPISYDGGTTYATYQVTAPSGTSADPDTNGFSSDYYPGSSGQMMNANSTIVKVVGNTSTSGVATAGCLTPSSSAPYDGNSYGQTYFAGAIYAAQAALQAEKAAVDPLIHSVLGSTVSSQNVIIFVSDGQANADGPKFPGLNLSTPSLVTASTASSRGVGGVNIAYLGTSTWSSTAKNLANVIGSWGQYPDFNNNCQQAMTAAQYAVSQGTQVMAVAYGAEKDGCLAQTGAGIVSASWPGRDSLNASALTVNSPIPAPSPAYPALNVPISTPLTIVPCVTDENIADSWGDFFAETSSVGCQGASLTNPMAGLYSIFTQSILGKLGPSPRLIPNSTT